VSKIPIDISREILWTDHRLSVTKTRFCHSKLLIVKYHDHISSPPQLLRRWEHGVMAMVTGSSYEKVGRCSYRRTGCKRERENSTPIGMKTITSRLLLSITSGRRFHSFIFYMLIENKVCFCMGKLELFELMFTVGYELRKTSVVAKSRRRIQIVFKRSRDRNSHRQSKQ
jgi:hypothetical protein